MCIIYITSPNLAKYPFTSSRVVVVESPPTKIFFVLVTICKENKIITIEILKYFKWVHRLNNKTFKTLLEMKINLYLLLKLTHLWCWFFWKSNFRINLFSIQVMNSKLYNFLYSFIVRKCDKTKSSEMRNDCCKMSEK